MAEIPDVGRIAAKWVRRAASAGEEYRAGVQSPRRGWQASTIAAAGAWQAGVQAAITQGRFARGVQRSNDGVWQAAAAGKGANRFAEGVTSAEGRYAEGFGPYAATIRGLTLPPRGARGSPANIERVRVIAQALHARRTGSGGGGG